MGWLSAKNAARFAVGSAVAMAAAWSNHVQQDADHARAVRATTLITPIPGMISVQRRVLSGDEPAAVAVVAARAEHPLAKMKPEEIVALAAATGTLMGLPPDGHPRTATDLLAGQETLRQAMAEKCGDCAPAAANMLSAPHGFGDRPTSAAVAAEALARGGELGVDPMAPFGGVGAAIRRGEDVDEGVWAMPGVAGFAALEAARAGRVDLRPKIQRLADGEAAAEPADQFAAREALARLDAAP